MTDVDKTTAGQTAGRRERRHLGLTFAVALVAAIVVATVVVVVGGDGLSPLVLGIVLGITLLMILVSVGIGLAFAFWRRRRGSAVFARSPLWELERRDRKRLVRALRRGEDIPPERHDLAIRTARDLIGRRKLVWLYVALSAIMTANVLLQTGFARWLYLAAVVLWIATAVYLLWLVRRMRHALDRLEPPTLPITPR